MQADGLRPLLRDLNRADKTVAKEVRAELKSTVGELVAGEARSIATHRLEQRTGRTVKRIKPTVVSNTVVVRNTAQRAGFHYPNVLEFGGRGASEVGPRASLYPALDAREDDVVRLLGEVLDNLGARAGFS